MKKCVIIFGPPGVGKGTQSRLLSERYNLKHISTGDIIRNEIKSGSDLGKRAESIIKGGNLLDNETVIAITEEALKGEKLNGFNGYILDGYPRTIEQAQAVLSFVERNEHDLMPIVCLKANNEVLVERIKARGIRPGESENVADEIANRMRVYEEQTKPVLDVLNGFAVTVDSTRDVEVVFSDIEKALRQLDNGLKLPVD